MRTSTEMETEVRRSMKLHLRTPALGNKKDSTMTTPLSLMIGQAEAQ